MLNNPVRLAVAGAGNNISALFQGAELCRSMTSQGIEEAELPGVTRPRIGGLGVMDLQFVAAFDVHPNKTGRRFRDAVLAGPNNYPLLDTELPDPDFEVMPGLREGDQVKSPNFARIVRTLVESRAEVLLYSLPTGLQWAATAYALAALEARVAFVNCTPEIVGRSPGMLDSFTARDVPLVGDDLASQLGASVVHRSLLGLLAQRGLTLNSSYQVNFGGNEDFRNLREHGGSKQQSKINALTQEGVDTTHVEVIPSAGFLAQLKDNKVAILNIEGSGWGGTPVSIDLKLKVQDSSNAAGVIIDLVRIAAASHRLSRGGFPTAAAQLLKSPPQGYSHYPADQVTASLAELDASTRETLGASIGTGA